MNKVLVLSLTSTAILLLTGCGSTVTEQPVPQQSQTITEPVGQPYPVTTALPTAPVTTRPSTTRAVTTTKRTTARTTTRKTTAAPTTAKLATIKSTTEKPVTTTKTTTTKATTKATTQETTKATTTTQATTVVTAPPLPKTQAPVSFSPDKISDYPAYVDVLKTNRSILVNEKDSKKADYALCDLDADGIPELWIVIIPYWDQDNTRLYTLSGNKATLVKSTTGRSWFMPTKTGFIHTWGSSGASDYDEEYYIYRGGTKLERINAYSIIDDVYKENSTVLTESEYKKAVSQYGSDIKLNTASVSKILTTSTSESKKTQFSGRGTPDSSDGFANLRSSMDYSDNVVFAVKNGQLMTVKSTDDPEWYWVVPDHSGYGGGYMKASLVCLFDDLKNVKKPNQMDLIGRGTSTSSDGFLNVHSDPSLSDKNIVDTLPNGAYADIYDYGDKTWCYIKTATGYGYVKSDFIKMLRPGEKEKLIYNSEFGYVEN